MKLLIATYNLGKLKDYQNLLKDYPLEVTSLEEEKITADVEETGQTFEENSLLKARFFCKLANLPALADDGGLIIDALNNAPSVHSRRWKGYRMTDQEMVDYAWIPVPIDLFRQRNRKNIHRPDRRRTRSNQLPDSRDQRALDAFHVVKK